MSYARDKWKVLPLGRGTCRTQPMIPSPGASGVSWWLRVQHWGWGTTGQRVNTFHNSSGWSTWNNRFQHVEVWTPPWFTWDQDVSRCFKMFQASTSLKWFQAPLVGKSQWGMGKKGSVCLTRQLFQQGWWRKTYRNLGQAELSKPDQ